MSGPDTGTDTGADTRTGITVGAGSGPAPAEPGWPRRGAAVVEVLVVEDDAFTRQLIGRMLDPLQFRLRYAADSAEALRALRDGHPDIVLMDIRLPGMDGLALTRRLKAAPRQRAIPVVMMTGDARRETVLGSLDAGAAAFVVKPFDRAALLAKIRAILPG